jgi:hypothetical protein
LIDTAVLAVAREIAREGEFVMPLAVSLRTESSDEVNLRICADGQTDIKPRNYRRVGNCTMHSVYDRGLFPWTPRQ